MTIFKKDEKVITQTKDFKFNNKIGNIIIFYTITGEQYYVGFPSGAYFYPLSDFEKVIKLKELKYKRFLK